MIYWYLITIYLQDVFFGFYPNFWRLNSHSKLYTPRRKYHFIIPVRSFIIHSPSILHSSIILQSSPRFFAAIFSEGAWTCQDFLEFEHVIHQLLHCSTRSDLPKNRILRFWHVAWPGEPCGIAIDGFYWKIPKMNGDNCGYPHGLETAIKDNINYVFTLYYIIITIN